MPTEDKLVGQRVMREITKRSGIDCSDVRVYVASGVVYLNGKIRTNRGEVVVDLKHEMGIVTRSMRTIPGVREVVDELDYR